MSGVHRIEVTYEDGRREVVECGCDWCIAWRALPWEKLDDWLRGVEPEVRPDWLPAGRGEGIPRAGTDPYADVRRIATPMGGDHVG